MSKNKVFVKCGICEYQFDRKLVGKLQEGQEFVCVACSLGKHLAVLEERVNKLENSLKQDITDLKSNVAEIKAILVEFKGILSPSREVASFLVHRLGILILMMSVVNFCW